ALTHVSAKTRGELFIMADMQHVDPVLSSDDSPEERLHELKRRVHARFFEHRRQVRDLLAVTRAIVRRTAPAYDSVEDFAAHLDGRLDALARVQEILMRVRPDGGDGADGADGADLAEVVSGE